MDPTRLKDLFAAAADLAPDRRWRFLDEQCPADPDLRTEVEALLAAHDSARSFLPDPTIHPNRLPGLGVGDTFPPAGPALPSQIGPYRPTRLIGEGGFGSVYAAEQERPVRRTVALKLIKPGMDTKQVIARFEAERQALALMDHPHIARVFDAGATDAGRPYFVMELVDGVPITRFCDDARLPVRARLELFAQACHAVQHAHQKGVIHRDLKPTNVLIARLDGLPVPKIIDFGVAKATGRPLSPSTLLTEHRQMIGTPEYMPPEQAETSGLDADTRSDVYALGVLLYELLTGTTPFDGRSLRGRSYADIQRTIREVDPPRPSARLASLGAALPATAALRRADPGRLPALVGGELDWVVMKCLEKDRARRYESVAALAADVKRFLDDEPVLARPQGAAYRVRKFVRRHRAAVAAAAALAMALLLGIAGTTAGMLRARSAQRAAEVSGDAAVAERNAARAAQQRAEDSAAAARREAARAAAVGDFMRYVFALAQPEGGAAGGQAPVGEVLRLAAAQVSTRLRGQADEQLLVHAALAEAFGRLDMQDDALAQLQAAHRLCVALPGAAESEQGVAVGADLAAAMYVAGRGAEAVPAARATLDTARKVLGENHPATWKATNALALVLSTTGAGRESHDLWEGLVTRLRPVPAARTPEHLGRYLCNYAVSLQDRGRPAEALAAVREAAAVVRESAPGILGMAIAPAPAPEQGQGPESSTRDSRPAPPGAASPAASLAPLAMDLPTAFRSQAWMIRLMVEAGKADEVMPLLERYLAAATLLNPGGTPTLTDRIEDLAQLKLLTGDRAAAAGQWRRAIEMGARLGGVSLEQSDSRWRQWLMVKSPFAPPWASDAVQDHAWCAMQDLLRDNAPQHLVTESVDVDATRLKLLRWPDAAPVVQGTLDAFRTASEPPAGLYALGVEVPRPGAATLRRAFWLPIARWDLAFHPIPRFESVRTGYNDRWARLPQALDAAPYERRTASALAMHELLPLTRGRPERLQWFGVVATTRLDLPAGPYRFSASSDDGLRLWVDGRPVLDNWVGHASFTYDADVTLDAGPHDLRVEFFQHVGGYELWLQIAPRSPEAKRLAASLGGGIPQLEAHLMNVGHRALAKPDDVALAGELAYVQGMAGRFDESRATYARVVQMDGGHRVNAYLLACLHAYRDDVRAYAERCAALLGRFGGETDPLACEQIVRACCVAPEPASTDPRLRELVGRIRQADDGDPHAPWQHLATAMYDYRAGRPEEALAGFRLAASTLGPEELASRLTAEAFAAMCEHKLGRANDARASLARAEVTFDEQAPIPRVDFLPHGQVDHWLVCYTVLREARALVR